MSGKKYRVMVVDDEYWGRENLRRAICWEDYGLEMAEPACDGEEALERLKKEAVDILLTDIDMPFMDGLALMKELKVSHPEICCIAVSGYDDFDKVKGFFLSGGIDYLLKPVGKEELIKVLTKVLETLEKRSREEQASIRVSSLLEDTEYSSLLNKKLYGGRKGSTHVGTLQGSVVMVKFHDIFRIAETYGREMGNLSGLLKERLWALWESGESAIVFNYISKMSEFLMMGSVSPSLLEQLGERVKEAFPLPDFGPVSVVINPRSSSLDEIGEVYRELMATLVTRPFSREFFALTCRGEGEVFRLKEHLDHRLEVELARQLQGGNWEAAKKVVFERAGFGDCLSGDWTVLETEQFLARLCASLEEVVRSTYPDRFGGLEDLLATLDLAKRQLDSAMAVKAVRDFLDEFSEEGEEKGGAADQLLQVRAFLEENYGESLGLPMLAQRFHLDPNYLSRSYSQRFSETITASLTRIRISRAIEMMHDPERKLESISFMVGYDDYNYFSRVFRKKVGKSPSEYRKSILV